MGVRGKRRRITQKKKAEFLEKLLETLAVTKAADAVGFSARAMYYARDKDEEFAEAWAEVDAVLLATMEDEAMRRAVQGVDKPVFYKGEACGTVKEFSDTLLIFLMKARDPEKYRERSEVKHAGTVTVTMPPADAGTL